MTHSFVRLRILFICFVALVLSTMVVPVRAPALNAAADANGNFTPWVVVGWDPALGATFQWTVSLNPVPAAVAPVLIAADQAGLAARFPGWAFGFAAAPFGGILNVVRYDADIGLPWNWPFDFVVQYAPGAFALPAGHVFQWIQFVTTTSPHTAGAGAHGVAPGVKYLDAYDYDWNSTAPAGSQFGYSDGTPFYWTDAGAPAARGGKAAPAGERAGHTVFAGGVVIRFDFTDKPWRFLREAAVGAPVTWVADLYLVDYNPGPPRTVVIDNAGVRWGFSITRVPVAALRPAGPQFDRGGVDGDKYDGYDVPYDLPINATMSGGVGGIAISVDKFGLLAPYIGLASTIMVAAVATTIYVKRVKHRKDKK